MTDPSDLLARIRDKLNLLRLLTPDYSPPGSQLLGEAADAIERLTAERDAALADAARIDFLGTRGEMDWELIGSEVQDEGRGVREAIDDAMRAGHARTMAGSQTDE